MAAQLEAIVSELSQADRQERIELLIDFAKNLPPLPERLERQKDAAHRVEECVGKRYVIGVVCAYLQDVEDAVGLPRDKRGRVARAVGERGRVRRSPTPWRGDPIARSCRRRRRKSQFNCLRAR